VVEAEVEDAQRGKGRRGAGGAGDASEATRGELSKSVALNAEDLEGGKKCEVL